MKSVWVIEQGQYSDYCVVGVFTSEENAKTVCNLINASDSYDEATIAEWPLDPAVAEINAGMSQYCTLMLKTGDVESCRKLETTYGFQINTGSHIWKRSTAPEYQGTGKQDVLNSTVWATDDAHAIKITNEIRTRMIANGEWK